MRAYIVAEKPTQAYRSGLHCAARNALKRKEKPTKPTFSARAYTCARKNSGINTQKPLSRVLRNVGFVGFVGFSRVFNDLRTQQCRPHM